MEIIDFLASNSTALFVTVAVFGLLIGSFLNVVIYRLPVMLNNEWRIQCCEFLELDNTENENKPPFNLVTPRSRCPHCNHQITALENIPILSYLWQRGRCSDCKAPISLRYPLVELSSALLACIAVWHFGWGWELVGALLLSWTLLALSLIDYDHQILPDNMVFPLLWLGIIFNFFSTYTSLESSVWGAIIGYLSLWSVYQLFKLVTGKEGMGYGDFKLLAALGAWLGWQALPQIILLSSLVGAVLGLSLILLRGRDKNLPIPFGPYLACAGWIYLIWGQQLTDLYLSWNIAAGL